MQEKDSLVKPHNSKMFHDFQANDSISGHMLQFYMLMLCYEPNKVFKINLHELHQCV